jgi:hypothetical protein
MKQTIGMSMKLKKPIIVKLEVAWVFTELPDDFEGTRQEAIEYFKNDVSENFNEFFDGGQVESHLTAS